MSENTQSQRPLEEAPMSELWRIAKSLKISKEGKKEDLIARIRAANPPEQPVPETPKDLVANPEGPFDEPPRPVTSRGAISATEKEAHMSENTQSQRPLEEAPMSELWRIAKSLKISKEGKKEDLIARIRAANPPEQPVPETPKDLVANPEGPFDEPPRPVTSSSAPMRPQDQFRAAMQEINMVLADHPGVLDIVKVKRTVSNGESEMVRDVYSWAAAGPEYRKVRDKVQVTLQAAWQSGALNYDMIARALRLPPMSVQALIDVEFIEANGL